MMEFFIENLVIREANGVDHAVAVNLSIHSEPRLNAPTARVHDGHDDAMNTK